MAELLLALFPSRRIVVVVAPPLRSELVSRVWILFVILLLFVFQVCALFAFRSFSYAYFTFRFPYWQILLVVVTVIIIWFNFIVNEVPFFWNIMYPISKFVVYRAKEKVKGRWPQ